jgi:hypothetical protein
MILGRRIKGRQKRLEAYEELIRESRIKILSEGEKV